MFTKVCRDTINLLVKGTARTGMKAICGKTTVKTSATSDVGRLTKSLKVTGYCLLINIHEIIVLPFSAYIHCESKWTKSNKKQHQLHVLAALVSTLAHTVHEGKSRVDLHELRRQFSSPKNALCTVYQHLWRVQSIFEGGSKRSGVYMPLLASVSHNQAITASMS